MKKPLTELVEDIWALLSGSDLRDEGRVALLNLIEAYGFSCGSRHDLGRDCPGHQKQRAAARKVLK